MKRNGFTIVELLMVIGIIAVLMGIVTTAASSSIRATRAQRMRALCTLVQAGLATYHEQTGEWPVSALNNEVVQPNKNGMGTGGKDDPNIYLLSATEVRQAVKAMVERAKQNSPVMDISGLFVARQDNELTGDSRNRRPQKPIHGLDFMSAVRGTPQSPKKMSTSEMYFGYPDPDTGLFLRFKMVYSIAADQILVKDQRNQLQNANSEIR